MVDKVKPLKIENPALGGTELDLFPREADPSEDYLSAKGVALEDNDNTVIFGDSGIMKFQDTDEITPLTLSDLANRLPLEFGSVEDASVSTTTSNNFVTKITTSPTLGGGTYLIMFYSQFGNSQKKKKVSVRFRVDSVERAILTSEIPSNVSLNDLQFSGFDLAVLSAGSHTFDIQFGDTDNGGTASIENARIAYWRVL